MAAEVAANDVIGSPVGAFLFAALAALPFGLDAATFAIGALLVSTIRTPLQPERLVGSPSRLRSDIVEGLRFLMGHSLLRGVAIGVALVNVAVTGAMSILVLLVLEDLGGSESTFGVMLGISAAGGLVASAVAERVAARLGRRATLVVTTLIVCASTAALGLAGGIAVATGLLFVGIGSVAAFNIIGRSIRQAVTPNQLLGRVVASFRMVAMAGGPIGAALGGLFASLTSVRATFLASGAIGLIATLQMVVATRGLDEPEREVRRSR